MLSMQVPPDGPVEGVAVAGMAHHKLHDANWTGLGLRPHQDPQPRFLYPPSTAATLNLAAVGAQCARVWKPSTALSRSAACAAAETAWERPWPIPRCSRGDNFTGGGDMATATSATSSTGRPPSCS